MRVLEVILVLLLAGQWLLSWQRGRGEQIRRARFVVLLFVIILLILALHVLIERPRWQMYPAYLVTLILVIRRAFSLAPRATVQPIDPTARVLRTVANGLIGLTLISALALSIIFPVNNLPTPTGAYRIGTVSIALRDEQRAEIFTDDPKDKRELMIQIWYPATPPLTARQLPWMQHIDIVGPAITQWIHMPSFLLDHTGLVRSNAYADAPLSEAEATYPVVIYSHGWGGFRNINADQLEALASHGYIVVSIDHPYGALITLFNDDRIIMNKRSLLPERGEPTFLSSAQTLVQVFSQDERFVMDQLAEVNRTDPRFIGRMDLSRIGLFGHSTGGGAVINTCAIDTRCKAGFGMDPWVEPVADNIIASGLTQPFVFMRSEEWTGPNTKNDPRLSELYAHMRGPIQRISVRGSRHYDFTLIGLLSPLAPALKLKGPIDGPRMLQLVDEHLVAFFDSTLKGKGDAAMQQVRQRFPESESR